MERNDAVYLNDGSFTRLQPFPKLSAALDITLTYANDTLAFEWKVIDSSCSSDHLPVFTTYEIPNRTNITQNNGNKNIVISYKKLATNLNQTTDINNIKSCDEFTEHLQNIIKKSEIKINQQKPWWNKDCSEAFAKTIQATEKFKKDGITSNYIMMEKKLK